jgi:acetolactate synthase-1/2/3 large subunit
LRQLGVTHVFGLPGTQNIDLFEELRLARLRTIVPTHELAAGFMANGYYRASGKPGVVTTIPGPGFTYMITALAEASHDSAAMLYIVEKPAAPTARRFALQAIDQHAIAAPLVKQIVDVDRADDVQAALYDAYRTCSEGEPGPVLLHVARAAFDGPNTAYVDPPAASPNPPRTDDVEHVRARLAAAKRPLLFVGQGAAAAAPLVKELAEALNAPVVTTRSGRGIIAEDHPLSMRFDASAQGTEALNVLISQCDLVLALGCKFTQNGALGFRLEAPEGKLIHVDAGPHVLNANYPASRAIRADVAAFLEALGNRLHDPSPPSAAAAIGTPRTATRHLEPLVGGSTAEAFFQSLRRALPRDARLVTDTGLHQVLATRYFTALWPRGFIIPTDFQSMGFGLPAAIGAKLAEPERPVVALIGDGGFLMCGAEIRTAVRENVALAVIVFNDGAYGQIRMYQHAKFGRGHGIDLALPDIESYARALGASYFKADGYAEAALRQALGSNGVVVVDVTVKDTLMMRVEQAKGFGRSATRRMLSAGRRRPARAAKPADR